MRNHQSTTDDDPYEIINGKKVLKDGARVHVTLMDAERARRRARLTDAAGRSDPLASPHRRCWSLRRAPSCL